MSQEYTPVDWVDETTSQQGTLINAERLDQMQTAHHYADGFEEVDAIPTEDPGVDYHKVVYCTADSTFYRWDGTQWTADIDEDTKHLLDQEIARAEHAEGLIQGYLDAHEANHSNPHQVTKAQVGLGNCDNTADLDKPISTAAQAALDTKADKATTLAGYGITDAVATSGAQTVGGVKTFTDNPLVSNGEPGIIIKNTDVSASDTPASTEGATIHFAGSDGQDLARIGMTKGSSGTTILRAFLHGSYADTEVRLISNTLGSYMTGPARAYDPANTFDIMTIGVFKAQTDLLLASKADTTALTDGSVTKVGTADLGTDTKPIKLVAGVPTAVGHDLVTTDTAQTISGAKTLTAAPTVSMDVTPRLDIKRNNYAYTEITSSLETGRIRFQDKTPTNLAEIWSGIYKSGGVYSTETNITSWVPDHTASANLKVLAKTDGTAYATIPNRAYNANNTSDAVNIASLQASTDVIHTIGNEVKTGLFYVPFVNSTRIKNTGGSTNWFIFATMQYNFIATTKIVFIVTSRNTAENGFYTLSGTASSTFTIDTDATTPASVKIVTDGTTQYFAVQIASNNIKKNHIPRPDRHGNAQYAHARVTVCYNDRNRCRNGGIK